MLVGHLSMNWQDMLLESDSSSQKTRREGTSRPTSEEFERELFINRKVI